MPVVLPEVFDVPLKLVLKCHNTICSIAYKYKDPPITWGQLSEEDDGYFFDLLLENFDVDDPTFHALLMLLHPNMRSALRYLKWERHATNLEKESAIEMEYFFERVYKSQLKSA